MIHEEATKEAFGYYASELKPKSNRLIIVACELCGKFRVVKREDYHTFCNSCSRILGEKSKGTKNPMFGTHKTEEEKTNQSVAIKGKKHTDEQNAEQSARTKGEKNPNWKPKIKCICTWCRKIFPVLSSRIKRGEGKHCCSACAIKDQRHNSLPKITAPEKAFQQICIDNNLPFKFVGDGTLWLGNANPDFVHKSKKIVVEVFGDYWHSPLLNYKIRDIATIDGRRRQLKAEGYKAIFIWESDLKRKDAEAFVLYLMEKEKIV